MQRQSSPKTTNLDPKQHNIIPDISVIIVNYNVRDFLAQALRSVAHASVGLTVETFVVDNNSADGSVEMVRRDFPSVKVIANKDNVGFGTANNQAIRESKGRYLYILNPDTVLSENTLAIFVDFLDDHPDAGAVGCRILNPDGTFAPESRRGFPTPAVAFYRMSGLGKFFPKSKRFGQYHLSYLPADEVNKIDALSGSSMVVRREAVFAGFDEINAGGKLGESIPEYLPDTGLIEGAGGGFDEDYFMYAEDLDWCFRIQKAGWNIYYTPETEIIHYKGESTRKGELRYVKLFYGAMIQFSEKHFSGQFSAIFRLLLLLGIWFKAGVSLAITTAGRLKKPFLDAALSGAFFAGATFFWTQWTGKLFGPLFWQAVLPFYILTAVTGLALTGNYSKRRPARIRAVFSGLGLAFLAVIVVSFFVKQIAYSRAILLLGFTGSLLSIGFLRLIHNIKNKAPRRCVLVGTYKEATRLQSMLITNQHTNLVLDGFVSISTENIVPSVNNITHLGTIRQLRDIVRLHGLTDVIFAAAGVSHHIMFTQMQLLHDLPIQFRIFAEHYDTLIGKATIDDLAAPALRETDPPAGYSRNSFSKRLFEVTFSLAGLLLLPLIWILRILSPATNLFSQTYYRFSQLGTVLSGKKGLIGFDPTYSPEKTESVKLKPAIFALTDFLPAGRHSKTERNRAYQWYAQKQSLSLDLEIIWRILSQPFKQN